MSRRACVVVVLLALLASTFFFLTTERINRNDAALYDQIAKNLAAGNGFSSMIEPPHNWVGGREPLYPFFISLGFRVLGANLLTVFLLQVVCHALTALLIGRIALDLSVSARTAALTAAAVAVFPALANYTVYTLRETFVALLVTLATFATLRAWNRVSVPWAAAAGLAWGATMLSRAVVLPLPCALGAAMVVAAWWHRRSLVRVALTAAVLIAVSTASLAPWMAYTARVDAERKRMEIEAPEKAQGGYVRGSAAPRAWLNIYIRAIKAELPARELAMYATYVVSESLADRLFPGNNLRSVGEGYFYRPTGEKVRAMRAAGATEAQIEAKLKQEALQIMRRHPFMYALTGLFEFVKFNSFGQVPLLNEAPVEHQHGGTVPLLAARAAFKALGFVVLALAVAGAWVMRDRGATALLLIVAYFNVIHMALDSIGRYAIPVTPCYLLLAVVALRTMLGVPAMERDRAAGGMTPVLSS